MQSPTYQSGFYAPARGGIPQHPSLQRGCVLALDAGLGCTGPVLRDQSVSKNHGTLGSGTTWTTDTGRASMAFSASKVTLDRVPDFYDFTLSVWVRPNGQANGIIFGGFASPNPYIRLLATQAIFRVNGTNYTMSLTRSYSDLTLAHFAVVRRGTSITTFRNGILNGSQTTVANVWQPNQVGAYGVAVLPWQGDLSDFRVYDHPLSGTAIQLLARRRGIAYEPSVRPYAEQYVASDPFHQRRFHESAQNVIGGSF